MKIIALIMSLFLAAGCAVNTPGVETVPNVQADAVQAENVHITAKQAVQDIRVGWNLGNSLDSHNNGYGGLSIEQTETYWGNSKTVESTFINIKNAGFNAVRIPVTWQEHILSDQRIDPAWLSRVKQVVDMAMDQDLYVIIDIHHDKWVFPSYADYESVKAKMSNIWTQVGNAFKDYDDKLMFEALNEPRLMGLDNEWTGSTAAYEIVNKLNTTFVGLIRGQGGNNSSRILIIQPYCAGTSEEILSGMTVPADENVIVAVHAYTPYDFALNQYGTNYWSASNPSDTAEINNLMARLNSHFVSKGVPVLIDEFGALAKGNNDRRIEWVRYYKAEAAKYGIKCFWWDDGGNFKLYDRNNGSFTDNELLSAIIK